MTIPAIGSLGKAIEGLIQSENTVRTASLDGAMALFGNIAKVMEGLIPSQGSVHAAAGEVSRLAQLLADATEEPMAGDSAAPTVAPDTDVSAMPR
jgi:hypothetical protein